MAGKNTAAGTGSAVNPDGSCADRNCPAHGSVRLRGARLVGVVKSAKMKRSASISVERTAFVRKYERGYRKNSTIKVHNPECVDAVEGDKVEFAECRPLSKTKHFVIVRKVS